MNQVNSQLSAVMQQSTGLGTDLLLSNGLGSGGGGGILGGLLSNGSIGSGLGGGLLGGNNKPNYFCKRHPSELLKFYCRTCSVPVCKDCMLLDHPNGLHDCEHNSDTTPKQIESLLHTVSEVRAKAQDLRSLIKNVEHSGQRIQLQYHKAQNEIEDTHQFYRSMVDERKAELQKELENFYNAKTVSQSELLNRSQDHVDKMLQSCEFVERLTKCAGPSETIMLRKFMENKLMLFPAITHDLQASYELEFVSNYQAIQIGVRNTYGYIRSNADLSSVTTKQPPIARPTSTTNGGSLLGGNRSASPSNSSTGSMNLMSHHHMRNGDGLMNGGSGGAHLLDHHSHQRHQQHQQHQHQQRSFGGSLVNGGGHGVNGGGLSTSPLSGCGTGSSMVNGLSAAFDTTNLISKRFNSANSLGPFVGEPSIGQPIGNAYEKWSNGGGTDLFNNLSDQYTIPLNSIGGGGGGGGGGSGGGSSGAGGQQDPSAAMIDLTAKLMSSSMFPPKSQIKRQKMIYHCKFGEFGVMEGQFTEPSGVAVNAQNDIIVADTNNHRIQIFDKEGRFKFQFGECGKRDGQLLYPNRVAVVRTSGDIIVTERSPTHQIQIYNQYGQFVRKFGANILQHPRGVTVDSKGRIVVVECKVMRVIIFDQSGNVLQKFGCSKHLEFPNGVVVNDKQEIFISDNRAHCVKVFNYEGQFLRQIGGEGVTNYPIGVGINASGEILIADNHNNFNLTIFTQDGQLVSAMESKVKHAQCFDVALMDDGSVVLASKDYRLYIYRYVQVPPIGL